MPRKHPAPSVYFTLSFATSAIYSLIFTVNLLYYIFVARLDPLQLVLVGTALEAAVFLFEVPTGVVADSISRRLSVIVGVFIIGLAFLINALWPVFWVIMLAQVVWALGYTFTSGATQAWISDEIGAENAGQAFIRAARWEQWGAIAGTIICVFVAILSIRAPILIGGGLFILLGVYLALFMPEDGFQASAIASSAYWKRFAGTFNAGIATVKIRPALAGILATGFFFGFYSEGYDRLWQAHILERFNLPSAGWFSEVYSNAEMTAVFWNAVFKILLMLLAVFATRQTEKYLERSHNVALWRILLVLSTILFACLLGFALVRNLAITLVLVLIIGVVREVTYPIYTTWVNHRLPSNVRATVLSLSSQVDAVGQTIGGPVVGVVARQISIAVGLVTSSLMLLPILPLLYSQRKTHDADLSGD